MNPKPTEIRRLPHEISVKWNDGQQSAFPYKLLRQKCPCARCEALRQDKNPFRILPADDEFEKLQLIDIQPVGRYAIRLIWSDGHRTGIYTFEFLRSLHSGS